MSIIYGYEYLVLNNVVQDCPVAREDLKNSRDCHLCGSTGHGTHVRAVLSRGIANLKLNRIVLVTGGYTNIVTSTPERKILKLELL